MFSRAPLLTPRAALVALWILWLPGCSPDLGEIPFFCNKGNTPCPEGYRCTGGYCHREGECPSLIPECRGQKGPNAGADGGIHDDGSRTLPRGKFCNGLQNTDGSSFSMTLKVGSVSLSAGSGHCCACATLPAGKSPVTLGEDGKATPALSGTVTLKTGAQYIFWSNLDNDNRLKLEGGITKPGYTCESVSPFN